MHTPGPWHVRGFKVWEDLFRSNERRGIVAEIAISWRDSEEAEANARLIAAAPDLLEALEALRGGFFASLLSAAGAAPPSDEPLVSVPVDMIEAAATHIDRALTKART